MFYSQEYYYVHRKNGTPLGKLYYKYRNWKASLNRRGFNPEVQSKKAKTGSFPVTDDEETHIRALKHEYNTMDYEEKLAHWDACAATRMNSIRDIESSSKNIIDIWPQYKLPDGFRLVWFLYFQIYLMNNI